MVKSGVKRIEKFVNSKVNRRYKKEYKHKF